jgi:hypothetical protein
MASAGITMSPMSSTGGGGGGGATGLAGFFAVVLPGFAFGFELVFVEVPGFLAVVAGLAGACAC